MISTKDTILEQFENTYVENSVVRWKTNNRCPFEDILMDFYKIGKINEEEIVNTNQVRDSEVSDTMVAYINKRKEKGYSNKEKFEFKDAFTN